MPEVYHPAALPLAVSVPDDPTLTVVGGGYLPQRIVGGIECVQGAR